MYDYENNYQEEVEQPAKCWRVFRKIGDILGIVGLAGSILMLGICTAEAGIIFTVLGKKATGKISKKGLIFNIVGLVISLIVYMIIIAVIIPLAVQ